MTEAGCVFCTVVAALEHSEACPARAAGHVLRTICDLPASIAILAPDQYYPGLHDGRVEDPRHRAL
jgi:hypothetical protein